MSLYVYKFPPLPIKTTIVDFESKFPSILPSSKVTECTSEVGLYGDCRYLVPKPPPWVERDNKQFNIIKAEHIPCRITGIACMNVAKRLQQSIEIDQEIRKKTEKNGNGSKERM